MDCHDIHAQLRAGHSPAGPAVQQHVAKCEACADLVAAGPGFSGALDRADAADTTNIDSPAMTQLWAAVQTEVADDRGLRGFFRSRPTSFRIGAVLTLAGVLGLATLFGGPRADLGIYPRARMVVDLLLVVAPLVMLVTMTFRPLWQPPRSLLAILGGLFVGAAAVLLLCSMDPAHTDHPASLLGVGDDLVPRATACFLTGSSVGVLLGVCVRILSRRGRLWTMTAITAVLAAVVGNLVLYLHCPLVAPVHLWAGHVTVLLPMGLWAIFSRGGLTEP